MENSKEFYNATINKPASRLIQMFFDNKYNETISGNIALDLGCGTGGDTEFLISKGFKVTAVDIHEEVKEILENKNLSNEQLNILIGDFSKMDFPIVDLIFANMSLFFVKDNFDLLMRNLLEKVNKNGYFIANFLGEEDDWKGSKTTLKKEDLLNYFNNYGLKYFAEEKYFRDTALGVNKFWHKYTVIAQKK